ncbi:SGNH/GDSL hydrolase family protein [bacterium AH-315-F18]|nr:SGNH/GDSL hydrolase family protein [bacterium AH-315-F18]
MTALYITLGLLALLAAFALGRQMGKRSAAGPLRALIEVRKNALLLGQLAGDDRIRRQLAEAYHDTDAAFRELDEYHWDATDEIPTPFVGYMPAPSRNPRFATNQQQFRTLAEVRSPKPEGIFRIFLVGGSTAFGSGAPDQARTVAGYLEHMLNSRPKCDPPVQFEVFTAAAPAWASSHERIVIENLVSELQPDLVLALSGNNEAHWSWNFKNVLWFRSYAEHHIWKVMTAAYHVAGYAYPADPIPEHKPVLPVARVAEILDKNIGLSLHALAPTAAPFYFFLQPAIAVTGKKPAARESETLAQWHPAQIEYYREYYLEVARRLGERASRTAKFTFHDLSSIFDQRHEEAIFLDSYHFGDKGYEAIAQQMLTTVADVLPRPKGST